MAYINAYKYIAVYSYWRDKSQIIVIVLFHSNHTVGHFSLFHETVRCGVSWHPRLAVIARASRNTASAPHIYPQKKELIWHV